MGDDPANPKCTFYRDGVKKFIIDHPSDPERMLAHACIEGPETAVYYRGEGRLMDGVAHVELPTYFEGIASVTGRTVLLTPISDLDEPVTVLAATPVKDGRFSVRAATNDNPMQRFCWEVKAARSNIEPLEVEIERKQPALAGLARVPK